MCIERSLLDLINNSCRPKVPVQYNSLSLSPSLTHTHISEGRADTNRFSPPLLLLLLLLLLHYARNILSFLFAGKRSAYGGGAALETTFSSSRLKHLFSYLISGHTQTHRVDERNSREKEPTTSLGQVAEKKKKIEALLCCTVTDSSVIGTSTKTKHKKSELLLKNCRHHHEIDVICSFGTDGSNGETKRTKH